MNPDEDSGPGSTGSATPPPRRRFIAGAVCPRCGVQDRIVSYVQQDQQIRECVDCGFSDALTVPMADDAVPPGRLDAPRPAPADADRAQPIRFYPRPPRPPRPPHPKGDDGTDGSDSDR